MIHQARSYLTGAVLATTLIVVAIVAFMLIVSAQAIRDWPTGGFGGGTDSISVSAGQRLSPAEPAGPDRSAVSVAAATPAPAAAPTSGGGDSSTGGAPADAGAPAAEQPTATGEGGDGGSAPQSATPDLSGAEDAPAPSPSPDRNAGGPPAPRTNGVPASAVVPPAPPVAAVPAAQGVVTATVQEAISEVDDATSPTPQTNTPGKAVVDEVAEEAPEGEVGPETPAGEVVDEVTDPNLEGATLPETEPVLPGAPPAG